MAKQLGSKAKVIAVCPNMVKRHNVTSSSWYEGMMGATDSLGDTLKLQKYRFTPDMVDSSRRSPDCASSTTVSTPLLDDAHSSQSDFQ